MNVVHLTTAQRDSLLRQPESGMGWQWLEFNVRSGVVKEGVAFNAELLLTGADSFTALSMGLRGLDMTKLASTTEQDWFNFRVVSVNRLTSLSVKEATGSCGPASEGKPEMSASVERFVRFSAYINDRRVTADGRILPGSYATTFVDALNVKTGTQAVRRYALPNPEPAVFRFDIDPKEQVLIKRGIAQPANDQPGGGEEVILLTGTKSGTVTLPPHIIPAA